MSLRFRIEFTKKSGPRIAVVRELPQPDGRLKTQQIGTFTRRKKPETLLPKLVDEAERHEFHSYLSQLKFNKTHFHAEADQLGRVIIRLDERAKQKITELAIACDKNGIPFMPEDIMLNALLKRSAAAEAKLNHRLGKKVFLLESLGIPLPAITPPAVENNELRLPFQLLLALDKSLDDICRDFTALARQYKKTTQFKPEYFKYYAGVLIGNNQNKPSKWCYGIAIELLKKYRVDPLKKIPLKKVAEYWGWLQKGILSADKAIQTFMADFHVKNNLKSQVTHGIHTAYGLAI